MQIWELFFDPDNYENLQIADREFSRTDRQVSSSHWFVGEPMLPNWEPVHLEVDQTLVEGVSRARGDFYEIRFCYLTCRPSILPLFQELLGGKVEYVPFILDSETIYAINTLHVVDCLDLSCSDYESYTEGGILKVNKYCFRYDKMHDAHYFKIPETRENRTYVSDVFKQVIESNHLTGPVFLPIDQISVPPTGISRTE